jgi:hypothetical protein
MGGCGCGWVKVALFFSSTTTHPPTKIPFTTTLENELYKAWIKIQGLSGKTQYSTNAEESKE